MNAHDTNAPYRAVSALKSSLERLSRSQEQKPEFTRKLSFDEQRQLSPEAFNRYCDWLFAFNEPAVQRRIRQEFTVGRDTDTEYEGRQS